MLTLNLSVAEAAVLVTMVGHASTMSDPYVADLEPGEHARMVADNALKQRINAELGEAVIAAGGPDAAMLIVSRSVEALYALADSERDLRRYRASEKLDELATSASDAHYMGLDSVKDAYVALGRQTKAKLPADLSAVLASL